MRTLLLLTLMACLMGQSCVPAANNNPGDTSNGGSDNQIGGSNPTNDPSNTSGTVASFTITKLALKATFDASGVSSPGYTANDIQVRWDFTHDGTFDTDWSTKKTATFTYPDDGAYNVTMEMKDPAGHIDSATKTFNIAATNKAPTAVFNFNIIKGMTASLDASSSSDAEDAADDLRIRWDFDGDNTFDTDWSTTKTLDHTYATAGQYTIKLQVKDLNGAVATATQKIVASPITIRNGFITYGIPYMIGFHFRMINNLTGQVVTPSDVPALTRAFFTISEDNVPIDLSETNQLLYSGQRPMFLVLVLDFTGSMYDSGAIIPMMNAAKAFIDSQGETTYISLRAFYERDGGNTEIDDFVSCSASGKSKLKSDLDAFSLAYHDRGATEIWDLLDDVVANKFSPYDNGVNRGVVFLSDGHDTTSGTTVSKLIQDAQLKAVFFYAVGMAFRPQEYTADEPNLKKIASDTGGLYFTVNQLVDLATVFDQLSEDVAADWTLSYITLKSTGNHNVSVVCNYLDGYTTMTGKFPADKIGGDTRQGMLIVLLPPGSPAGQTDYAIYADYIPRNITTLRIKVTSTVAAKLTLYDSDSICKPSDGWTISPNVAAGQPVPADGWYTISSPVPLEYGSWGNVAKLTVAADAANVPAGSVHLQLPDLATQATLYNDKTIVFPGTDALNAVFP